MQEQAWEPKRYLINQKWWHQWCDFVNFDTKISLDNSCDVNLLPKQSMIDSAFYDNEPSTTKKQGKDEPSDLNNPDSARKARAYPAVDSEDSEDIS